MTPTELLDNFDKLVRCLAIQHLQEIQGGKLGMPTLEELNRCGQLHAFLEAGGTIGAVMGKLIADTDTDGCQKVAELNSMGADSCDGDCSVQALIPLRDGRYLRAAVTDDDCCEKPGLWFDFYGRWDGKPFEYDKQQGQIE